jgi:hypothetical protein
MEAKELRIGNYYNGDISKEVNIQQITYEDIKELFQDSQDDYYQPIKLTEEWLFKFGFQIDDKDECYIYDTVHLVSLYKGFNGGYQRIINGYNDGVELNHVHQLQNLYFALTGEELKT